MVVETLALVCYLREVSSRINVAESSDSNETSNQTIFAGPLEVLSFSIFLESYDEIAQISVSHAEFAYAT